MRWILLFLPLLALTQEIKVPPQIEKEFYQQLEKLKNYKPPELSPQEKKQLEEKVKEAQKRALQEQKNRAENQQITVPKDTVFYVFMSSSVPKSIWEKYMDFVESAKLQNNVAFVLRGCLNGCKYFKPTLEYVQSLLKTKNGERQITILIDPFLFKRFSITEVPCVGMTKGDVLINPMLSAGWNENLQSKGKEFLSCGDWAMPYHLKVLCEKSQDPTTCQLAQKYAF